MERTYLYKGYRIRSRSPSVQGADYFIDDPTFTDGFDKVYEAIEAINQRMGKRERKLSENLEEFIKEKGWSKYRLSKESGVPESVIYNIFKNDAGVSYKNFCKLAEVVGSADDLFDYGSSKTRTEPSMLDFLIGRS